MRSTYSLSFLAGALMAAATEGAAAGGEAVKKSIVPAKYSGRYKTGGEGPTAKFIKEQCGYPTDMDKFIELVKANGINVAEGKNKELVDALAANAHGAKGRTRMTLGNQLIAIARKGAGLKGLDGQTYDVKEAKPAPTGAAKAAQEAAGEVAGEKTEAPNTAAGEVAGEGEQKF